MADERDDETTLERLAYELEQQSMNGPRKVTPETQPNLYQLSDEELQKLGDYLARAGREKAALAVETVLASRQSRQESAEKKKQRERLGESEQDPSPPKRPESPPRSQSPENPGRPLVDDPVDDSRGWVYGVLDDGSIQVLETPEKNRRAVGEVFPKGHRFHDAILKDDDALRNFSEPQRKILGLPIISVTEGPQRVRITGIFQDGKPVETRAENEQTSSDTMKDGAFAKARANIRKKLGALSGEM